jgi:hypothetical protein
MLGPLMGQQLRPVVETVGSVVDEELAFEEVPVDGAPGQPGLDGGRNLLGSAEFAGELFSALEQGQSGLPGERNLSDSAKFAVEFMDMLATDFGDDRLQAAPEEAPAEEAPVEEAAAEEGAFPEAPCPCAEAPAAETPVYGNFVDEEAATDGARSGGFPGVVPQFCVLPVEPVVEEPVGVSSPATLGVAARDGGEAFRVVSSGQSGGIAEPYRVPSDRGIPEPYRVPSDRTPPKPDGGMGSAPIRHPEPTTPREPTTEIPGSSKNTDTPSVTENDEIKDPSQFLSNKKITTTASAGSAVGPSGKNKKKITSIDKKDPKKDENPSKPIVIITIVSVSCVALVGLVVVVVLSMRNCGKQAESSAVDVEESSEVISEESSSC